MYCSLKDFEDLYNLLTNKDLVGDITDDNTRNIYMVTKHLLSSPNVIVLMPTTGTGFTFTSINSIMYEAHLVTTQKEKKNVYENTLKAAKWIKDNTPIEILVSHIPVTCGSTLYYAGKIGMEYVGTLNGGYLKNGERIDVIIKSCTVDEIIRRLTWRQQ